MQFMHDLAVGSPFRFEFDRVTPEQWNQTSAMSRPDLDKHAPDPSSLAPVFHAATVDKPAPAADPPQTSEPSSAAATSVPRRKRGKVRWPCDHHIVTSETASHVR